MSRLPCKKNLPKNQTMKLVIVESPAKAKTINKYLGNDYKVIASFGHIRDLPSKNGSVLPDEDFSLKYEISEKSGKYVNEIINSAKKASDIFLATDPDREGESISWHIAEVLKDKKVVKDEDKFKRVAFNEITKKAVLNAISNPRKIDANLVNAQQARRALDYLVGFTLSPVLWRKLPGCKSAGRVQSVALRLICEREDEIERFISREFWDIKLDLINSKKDPFNARLTHIGDDKLEKFSITNKAEAEKITSDLKNSQFIVASIKKKKQKRNPSAPFITSSLQQEASRKAGFSAKKTMQIAQKLYEGIDIAGETIGLITYMRTDGVTIASDAVAAIRSLIEQRFGKDYLPSKPLIYKSKAKNAQEAHEAIRPTDITLTPEKAAQYLDKDQLKLYELIWKRTVACQMESVVFDLARVDLITRDKKFTARANGSIIAFDGFYKLYQEGLDDTEEENTKMLPPLFEGEEVTTKKINPEQHFTEPPPRYTEASLVKKLEELGIGRPSTYATIISVLQERSYANNEKKRFTPTELGRLLTAFLVGFFEKYVQYDFTADLESDLDKIAEGDLGWKALLRTFWQDFKTNIDSVSNQKITEVIDYVQGALDFHLFGAKDTEQYQKNKKCAECADGELSLKLGKFGAFLACSNYPKCSYRKSIAKVGQASEGDANNQPAEIDPKRELGLNEQGIVVFVKKGPYGWYVQLGQEGGAEKKPKRVPLLAGMNPATIDLPTALKLLMLPLKIGNHPQTNDEISLGTGRFGAYLKYQGGFTSIPKNLNPFAVKLDQAVELIAKKAEKVAKKGK